MDELPLTKKISSELLELILKGEEELPPLSSFSNHTQAVARNIKMVTEASYTVVGMDARDGLIRSRIEGRKKLPSFESKKEYNK